MPVKVLIFDLDGVLLRNPAVQRAIERRSSEFAGQEGMKDYRPYGHTVRMLNRGVGVNDVLEEYNQYVFSKPNVREMAALLTSKDLARARMWKSLVTRSHRTPHVFSNAPEHWVRSVLSWVGLEDVFADSEIVTPRSVDTLKPTPKSFQGMWERVGPRVNHHNEVLFLDDSSLNIDAARSMGLPSLLYTDDIDRMLMEYHNY